MEFLDILSFGVTTRVKFGSLYDLVNLAIEAGYRYTYPGQDDHQVKVDGITLNQVIGSAIIKCNIGGKSTNNRFIIGIGGEYNYTFNSYYQLDNASIKVNDINIRKDHSFSGIVLLGWGISDSYAFNLYYKHNILSPYNTQYIKAKLGEYDDLMKQVNSKSRIGISLVFYLHK